MNDKKLKETTDKDSYFISAHLPSDAVRKLIEAGERARTMPADNLERKLVIDSAIAYAKERYPEFFRSEGSSAYWSTRCRYR